MNFLAFNINLKSDQILVGVTTLNRFTTTLNRINVIVELFRDPSYFHIKDKKTARITVYKCTRIGILLTDGCFFRLLVSHCQYSFVVYL